LGRWVTVNFGSSFELYRIGRLGESECFLLMEGEDDLLLPKSAEVDKRVVTEDENSVPE